MNNNNKIIRGIMSIAALLCMALAVSAGCNQLVVSGPESGYQMTNWNFAYQHDNQTDMICGNAPYEIVGTPESMNVQITVTEVVTLEITANVTYTDMMNRTYQRTFVGGVHQYYPGYHVVYLSSEYNYQVGTYDVDEVKATKI